MLQYEDVSVVYGDDFSALIDFSLEVKEGEIVALVGESGSGKTTAIRTAMGILPGGGYVSQGDIRFEGRSMLTMSLDEWRSVRGTQISMIFQDSGSMLNPIRTIGSQFIEYIRAHGPTPKKAAWDQGQAMLERMGLPHSQTIMKSYPFQLSGGMRQRVGIAMAMVFQPRILLADEPTSALDVTTQAQIVGEMAALRDEYGTAIILVTHNLGMAAYMADRILVMKDGRVVDSGTRAEIIENSSNAYTQELLQAVPAIKGDRYV